MTPLEVQIRINELGGQELTLDVLTYVNVRTKCRFIDKDHGEWWVKPDNVFGGQRHPKRWVQRRVLCIDEVIKRVKEKHGDVVSLDVNSYVNCYTPVRFLDAMYGEWFATPSHVISGHGHPRRGIDVRSSKHVVSADVVAERVLKLHHGELILDIATYTDTVTPARFIDVEHGEWWSISNNVLNGHGHPMRTNHKKAKTFARSIRSFPPIPHWKTGELCYSQSGWEHATLSWLNERQYDFDWQLPFKTPFKNEKIKRNSIYTIDLYIKDGPLANTYVEIKGRFDPQGSKSQRNWEWFHDQHPNSKLWMAPELIEWGIIRNDRTSTELT